METKVCTKCLNELPKTNEYFSKSKISPDGFSYMCKECDRIRGRNYYKNNKEKRNITINKYQENNKEIIAEKNRIKYINNRESLRDRYKELRDANIEHHREWARNNAKKHRKKHADYIRERRRNDIQTKMRNRLRVRIMHALKSQGVKKTQKTINLLGCTYDEYKTHIESLFTGDMTWEKYMSAEIVADHIIPVYLFDMRDVEQQKSAFNYKNTTPMWASENFEKNSMYMGVRHSHRKEKRELLIPFLPKNNL